MPSVKQVADFIEALAPRELAEDWDNVGLLVEAPAPADRIMVALDITREVVQEAQKEHCGLIVAHHPLIFTPLKRLAAGSAVFMLAQSGISALCAHTNLDAAEGGVNDVLAAALELQDVAPFEPLGRIGLLASAMPAPAFAAFCAQKLAAPVQLADSGRPIQKVAVIGGSGGDYWPKALAAGADCLVTGEASHHDGLDAKQADFTLLAAGHHATEYPVVPHLAGLLQQRFADAAVLVAKTQTNPFELVNL